LGQIPGTESPPAGGRGTACLGKELGPVWSHVKALFLGDCAFYPSWLI
jgi:hypothetical protein